MKEEHGIDFDKERKFSKLQLNPQEKGDQPLTQNDLQIVDPLINDGVLLRFLVSRQFDFNLVKQDLYDHLEWRQTHVPVARLTDRTLNLLNKGIFYIHGRTKIGNPILYLDFKNVLGLLESKEIDPDSFCALHHFFASYILRNMLVPGQIEKWIVITNINQFPLTKLPVSMFKASNKELGTNWIDYSARSFIVNLTWMQSKAANFFIKFLDPVTQKKQIFCDKANAE